MKRIFMLIVALALGISVVMAQNIQSITITKPNDASALSVKSSTIDKAYLKCQYSYKWVKDTTDATVAPKTDDMILEIGKTVSKFYSYRAFQTDSALTATPDRNIEETIAISQKYRGGSSVAVFKNFPKGKETITDKIGTGYYLYEEELPDFQWTICDSTSEILGYPVQMATCSFRGRDYIAWFTTDIAVPEGPFKFKGLPGLIMKIADTENQYSFVMTGINKCDDTQITKKEYQYLKTTRKKYLQTRRRFQENPIGFLTASSDVKISVRNEDGTENKDFAQQQSLKYDFIERQ